MPRPSGPSFQDACTGLSNRVHFEILYEFAFQLADRRGGRQPREGKDPQRELQKVAAETLRVALGWGGDRIAVPAGLGQLG